MRITAKFAVAVQLVHGDGVAGVRMAGINIKIMLSLIIKTWRVARFFDLHFCYWLLSHKLLVWKQKMKINSVRHL